MILDILTSVTEISQQGCEARKKREAGVRTGPPMAGYSNSLHILNSVARSSEPSLASFSPPRRETFGLSATVISTAFPRLALGPRPEGRSTVPCLTIGGRTYLHYAAHSAAVAAVAGVNVDYVFTAHLNSYDVGTNTITF